MKLITYSIKNNKFYRNNQEIKESIIKDELGGDRFRKLKREKEIRVRSSIIKTESIPKENKPKKIKKDPNEKLYEKNKSLYKVDHTTYKTGLRIELWRKNTKYGYYNFVTYLETDSEEEIKEKIILDIKEQSKKEKEKKNKSLISDDDI